MTRSITPLLSLPVEFCWFWVAVATSRLTSELGCCADGYVTSVPDLRDEHSALPPVADLEDV
jgi:hypothetical protein